jgi:hypothetical protein
MLAAGALIRTDRPAIEKPADVLAASSTTDTVPELGVLSVVSIASSEVAPSSSTSVVTDTPAGTSIEKLSTPRVELARPMARVCSAPPTTSVTFVRPGT